MFISIDIERRVTYLTNEFWSQTDEEYTEYYAYEGISIHKYFSSFLITVDFEKRPNFEEMGESESAPEYETLKK